MPLFRRRPLLRAAAVGGGAFAYGKHRARAEEQQQQEAYQAGQYDATSSSAPASTGITQQDTERLAELGKLHDQGVLTDEEFAQQKSRILGL